MKEKKSMCFERLRGSEIGREKNVQKRCNVMRIYHEYVTLELLIAIDNIVIHRSILFFESSTRNTHIYYIQLFCVS